MEGGGTIGSARTDRGMTIGSGRDTIDACPSADMAGGWAGGYGQERQKDIASGVEERRHRHGAQAHAIWREVFQAPTFVCAPMVLQSERAFRMLVRHHGCGAAWSPMAKAMCWDMQRAQVLEDLSGCPEDRPLVCQLCAVGVDEVVAAALDVQAHCDAVCLNLGCPQRTAAAAGFGAFLMDRPALVREMVSALAAALHVPVFAKIRVLPELADTLAFVQMLEAAGCSLVTVHGRTRDNTHHGGPCDWWAIRACVNAVCIPVVANGGVYTLAAAHECLRVTGAVAVMGAGGLLRNPRMFNPAPSAVAGASVESVAGANDCGPIALAREYLRVAEAYPPPIRCVRDHLLALLRTEIKTAGEAMYDMFARQQRVRYRPQFCLLVSTLAAILGIETPLACCLNNIKHWQPGAVTSGLEGTAGLVCRCGVGCFGNAGGAQVEAPCSHRGDREEDALLSIFDD